MEASFYFPPFLYLAPQPNLWVAHQVGTHVGDNLEECTEIGTKSGMGS